MTKFALGQKISGNGVQDARRTVGVDSHALWTIQYTEHFHEIDESSAETVLEKVRGCLLW